MALDDDMDTTEDEGATGSTGLVGRYFAAMRKGPTGERELMELFTDDAVYIEPFTGIAEPAVGRDAIRARLRTGWETPLPDLELDVFSVDVDGPTARAEWECRSTGLPGPVRGEDRYEIADGRIRRLEVRILARSHTLPDGLELVRTTATFDETSVPAGLLAAHRVADGVWGRLVVLDGALRFVFEDDPDGATTVSSGHHQVIPPGRPHHLELDGPVRFHVEFHR